ncbi:DUF58 domain-containing protein [Agromyces sp. MMS24-K17]|uniref:DUF58 domain-containing protein n=1 Tax=Agromyces sp. MMS24-K17 TaxID=3372850 RepID=UPI003754A078
MTTAAERRPRAPKLEVARPLRGAAGSLRDGAARVGGRVVPVVAAAGRAVGRRASVVTPFGWALVVAGGASVALGAWLGWRELLAAAIAVAVLFAIAIASILGRAEYEVRIDLAEARVVVGTPAYGQVLVANPARRRVPASTLVLPVGVARAEFAIPPLAAGERREEVFQIPTQRRAVLRLGPLRSVRRDALALLQRSRRLGAATDLYVHPRTVRLDSSSSGFLRDLEGLPTRDLSSDDVSFHALREYVPGDDLRHVHWKSTARSQRLMVRQFEETRRSQLAIVLSTRTDEYADADEFELAVSAAGSLGLQALAEGKDVAVLGAETPTPAEHSRRLLDGLSGVELVERARPAAEVSRTVARDVPGASVVVVLFGSSVAAEQMRSVSAALPLSARGLAVRVAPAEAPSRRTVGDLAVLTVPELDDLPRMIARAGA